MAFRRCQAESLCQPNAPRESDNNHGAGSSEAAQTAGICHRLRSRTHSKVNTEIGLFVHLYGPGDNNKTKTDGGLNGQQHSPMGQCWEKWTEQLETEQTTALLLQAEAELLSHAISCRIPPDTT